jgi:hypothetical protein
MKELPGTFSQGWNRARRRRGHVFQGRYHLWNERFKDRVDFLLGGHLFRVPVRDVRLQGSGLFENVHDAHSNRFPVAGSIVIGQPG